MTLGVPNKQPESNLYTSDLHWITENRNDNLFRITIVYYNEIFEFYSCTAYVLFCVGGRGFQNSKIKKISKTSVAVGA